MIKNFIFDFGNVLYKIAPEQALSEFINHSTKNISIKEVISYFQREDNIYNEYETGSISSDEFRSFLCNKFHVNIDNNEFDRIWNLTLLGLFPESLSVIKDMQSFGRLYLLSNTNEIHYNYFSEQCKELFEMFEKCYFSHQIGLRKPNPDVFKFVMKDLNISADETLFIDDSFQNIEAAKILGIRTYHINENNRLTDLKQIVKNFLH